MRKQLTCRKTLIESHVNNVWDAAQAKLEENKKIGEVVGHRGGQPHFLYGKVFCGECGAPMTRRTVNGLGGEKIKTWICREKRKGSGCKCRNVKEEAQELTIFWIEKEQEKQSWIP